MKRKMFLTAFVLMILGVALNGCCNRCKNKVDSSVPTSVTGQGVYAASAPGQSSIYSGRHATK